MRKSMSNCTKASLFFQDITDSTTQVRKEHSFTLQRFSYECVRKRNSHGLPYGPTLGSVLRLTLKSLPDGYLKELYQRLSDATAASYSIVTDAMFRPDNQALNDYAGAMIVTGWVIDVDEAYHSGEADAWDTSPQRVETTHELMTTTVDLLLQSITYVGNNNYQKTLPINY